MMSDGTRAYATKPARRAQDAGAAARRGEARRGAAAPVRESAQKDGEG